MGVIMLTKSNNNLLILDSSSLSANSMFSANDVIIWGFTEVVQNCLVDNIDVLLNLKSALI